MSSKLKTLQFNLKGLKGDETKKKVILKGGKGARKRRRRPMTKSRPYRVSVPIFKPKSNVKASNSFAVDSGKDFLTTLTLTTAMDVAGTVLVNVAINPFMIPTTRLSQLAKTYEFYRFKKLEFVFTPCKAIQDGSICGYVDNDTSDNMGTSTCGGQLLIQNISSDPTYQAGNVSKPLVWRYMPIRNLPWWKCDRTSADPMFTDCGRFVVLLKDPLGTGVTTTIGSITVEFTIEFNKPQMDLNAIGTASKITGSTGLTNSLPWGTTPLIPTWGTVPFYNKPLGTNNYFELYPGNYSVNYHVSGSGTAGGTGLALTSPYSAIAPTTVGNANIYVNGDSMGVSQFYSSEIIRCTFTLTNTNWTSGSCIIYITALPINAISATARLESQANTLLNKLLKFKADYKEVVKLDTCTVVEEKEEEKKDYDCVVVKSAVRKIK